MEGRFIPILAFAAIPESRSFPFVRFVSKRAFCAVCAFSYILCGLIHSVQFVLTLASKKEYDCLRFAFGWPRTAYENTSPKNIPDHLHARRIAVRGGLQHRAGSSESDGE